MAKTVAAERALAALREYALGFPAAHEDHPWGETALKVKGKVFVFLSRHTGGLNVSAKLPQSSREALLLPFAEATRYGLGKHGWVTASFPPEQEPPLAILRAWIDESYRAVAPAKLVAALVSEPAPSAAKRARRAK